jgi:hypothetical protein
MAAWGQRVLYGPSMCVFGEPPECRPPAAATAVVLDICTAWWVDARASKGQVSHCLCLVLRMDSSCLQTCMQGAGKARGGSVCSEAGGGALRSSVTWGEELEEEEEEEEAASAAEQITTFAAGLHRWLWGIIMPYEKCMWDLFMMALLVWVCFVSSYLISFGIEVSGRLRGMARRVLV